MSEVVIKDTIAAISTPIGEGGIGIVRMSGDDAIHIANKVFASRSKTSVLDQKSFTAQYGYIIDPETSGKNKIDEVLLFVMKKPKSYTTEDMVEIHCHGGRVVIQKILDICLKQGAQIPEPGEFTKRAFLNGRIDLVQAETVLDLIRAKTERSYSVAQKQLEGLLSSKIKGYRDEIKYLLSHIEASLDFPDDFVDPMQTKRLKERTQSLKSEIDELILSAKAGMMVKDGLKVVLTGKPNVGKSSLLNVIVGKERVIVSEQPGTTRDTVEENIEVNGFEVRLFDTAGIRPTDESLESMSIERSQKCLDDADLVLFVVDSSDPLTEDEKKQWSSLQSKSKVLVLNKSDQKNEAALKGYESLDNSHKIIATSCLNQVGIDEIKQCISSFILDKAPEKSDEYWIYSVRQLDLFRNCSEHLNKALKAFEANHSHEFIASDLNLAMNALGQIVGEVVTDDVLDLVFSQFCIGK